MAVSGVGNTLMERATNFLKLVKYWEIIADNLSRAGWSWGCVAAVDSCERTIFIADAHRDGQRFIVRADEKLTAFIELESAICALVSCVNPTEGRLHKE